MCFKEKLDLTPIDYSNKDNWLENNNTGKDVDVFFVLPTFVMESKYGDFASVDELKQESPIALKTMVEVYRESCNLYVPLYRQIAFTYASKIGPNNQKYLDAILNSVTYKDITNALDYYFKNINKGRPFILAGHSQGSAICTDLLYHYFQEHPEYLKLMVVAYTIGFAPSKKSIEKFNNLKFASNENDSGVIVSWNSEGPSASGKSILFPDDALVINPLNWKVDDTYADISLNKGSMILSKGGYIKGAVDAKINLKRGTLTCVGIDSYTEAPGVFQTCSLHELDYSLFFVNIRENIKKRIINYKNKNNL